jgi:lysophospholipase L1-like esterase
MKRKKMQRSKTIYLVATGIVVCVWLGVAAFSEAPASRTTMMHLSMDARLADLSAEYPFLQLDKNRIETPGDSVVFSPFYRKLYDLTFKGEGDVNIVHMGGSHVQAGAIGHRMRELFEGLAWGITDERGLVFPFRVAETNSTIYTSSEADGNWEGCRCAHNRHSCNWGMSGMVARTTTDSARLDIWAGRSDSSFYRSDFARLYVDHNERHFTPVFAKADLVDTVWHNKAENYYEWRFNTLVDTLSWYFVKTDSLAEGVSVQNVYLGNSQSTLNYHEIGVNGASTRSYLRCDDMERQLPGLEADLVIFGIGINDAHVPYGRFDKDEFITRYDSLVARFLSANEDTRFLFLTNNDSYRRRRPNPNGKLVHEAMYELAAKHDAAVWDLFEIMGGYQSVDDWDRAGLAKGDRIHFTRKGYYLQAELMYAALMKNYGDWLEVNATALNQSNGKQVRPDGYE